MAGFDNEVLYCDNVDFRGTSPISAQVTVAAELIIGTGGSPALGIGTLTSSDSSVTISYSSPNINLVVDTSGTPTIPTTFTTDSGSAVPALNILNILGGIGLSSTGAGSTVTYNADVSGSGIYADNTIMRGDGGATGVQDTGVTIDDSDVLSGATQINVDNLRLDGNTLSSTDTNGLIILSADGTGGAVIDTNLTVGDSTQDVTFTVNGAALTATVALHTSGASDLGGFVSERHSSTASFGAHSLFLRTKGTEGAPAVVADNDAISRLVSCGYDGTDFAQCAEIRVEVDGTPGADDMPGRIILLTSSDAGQTPTEALRIDSSQDVTLANALTVPNGGTGGTTFGDGYVLLGSGTSAVTALDVTAKGSLLAGDGTTDPVALAVGTNDQVLTADSTQASGLKWAAGAGAAGAWTFVSSSTASSSATIEFTDLSTSNFMYMVVIQDLIPVTDSVKFYFRTSTDNGTSFDSGASDYEWATIGIDTTSGSLEGWDAADSQIDLNLSFLGSDADESGSFLLYLTNFGSTNYTRIMYQSSSQSTGTVQVFNNGTGVRKSAADVDAIQFLMNSGNIETGVFKLYSLAAS